MVLARARLVIARQSDEGTFGDGEYWGTMLAERNRFTTGKYLASGTMILGSEKTDSSQPHSI